MKTVYLFVALSLLGCLSTYAQDIYFNAYTTRVITPSGTTVANLPRPTNGTTSDYVELLAYQYGFSSTSTIDRNGVVAGRAVPTSIELTKRFDVSSVYLQNAILAGQRIQTAQLVVRKTSGVDAPALITLIELKDALVTNFNTSAAQSGDCCPSESVQLIYSAIRITNYQQDTRGNVTAQSPQVVWNFITNRAEF
ncbi:type VI secretion system tube protein Hcp [Spirosoma validum]|uniref:Type VI secretion system tube protein Hcp n=1 Tax=Spirosoma validum TaxID=2771355 RepID=A0A927AYC4_9BACT|nr:type VI secretion system tube protein Hcp [Spirosoma validum]MBD2752013.1 type VI secretion system tube protein Hcp [Spirosoma validum]